MADELPPDEPPEERPDVLQSALEFRQQRARLASVKTEKRERGHDEIEPLVLEPASLLAAGPCPEREFLDRANLMPRRNVVLLGGDGGTGKSLLAMQLALACSTAAKWIGIGVDSGPVIYLSAEEDRTELQIRLREICHAEGLDLAEAHTLDLLYMAGEDAVLGYEKQGRLEVTTLFKRLERALEERTPELLVLDNLADVFAGNENNRSLAKAFIGKLRGLAIRYDCVVLLLAHPSLSGLSSGTGTSGSTAWSNSVRSRLYLHRPDGLEGEDQNARILESKKANYSAIGQRYDLKWVRNRFVRVEPKNPWDRVAVADVDRVRELMRPGHYRVSEQSPDWGGYAVAQLLDLDIGRGIPVDQRTGDQNRLRNDVRTYLAGWLRAKQLFVVKAKGPDRKWTQYFSVNQPEEDQDNGQTED